MTRELLELITDIRDSTTLFYVILRRETSGRFIKTESVKCDVCIIIVTSRKASVTTKRLKVIHCAIHSENLHAVGHFKDHVHFPTLLKYARNLANTVYESISV